MNSVAKVYSSTATKSNPGWGGPYNMAKAAIEALAFTLARACEVGGTDKIIVFDGTYGAINCSPEFAAQLIELAPRISREVEEYLLAKWTRQRGFDLDE
jgi:NAD(P)-dependent dehydrogenase (short-subunit alcohol dehydrogenase family)